MNKRNFQKNQIWNIDMGEEISEEGHENRPCLIRRIYQDTRTLLVVSMRGSEKVEYINGKRIVSVKKLGPYEVEIYKWKNAGLKKPTRVMCNTLRLVSFDNVNFYYGKLDNITAKIVEKKIDMYNNSVFSDPIDFMSWCKQKRVKSTIPKDGTNNNNNTIQDINDVIRTKEMNCVDSSLIVYKMCIENRYITDPQIIWIRWFRSETSTPSHLFTMFIKKNKNKYYAFNWLGDLTSKIEGPCSSDIELIEKIGKTLGKRYPNSGLQYYIFSDEDIEYIYNLDDNTTQRELLDYIEEHADFIDLGIVNESFDFGYFLRHIKFK